MATLRLSDVQFDPDVYLSYLRQERTDLNAYTNSGVAVTNAALASRVNGDGDITTIPYWNFLDASGENISSDDPTQFATPDKIGTGKQVARRLHINNAWQTANLVSSTLGSENPMQVIAGQTADYWRQRFTARIQALTLGIYNENVANGSSDMIFDVSTEDGDNATAANKWDFGGFVDARATMGENASLLSLLGVHPQTMAQIIKQNQIEYIQDSETGVLIPTYNGYRVVEDKKLPVIAGGTSGVKYVSVLYGQGAFGYAEGSAERPVATEYDELAANGAGVETLVERKQWMFHPEGYQWLESSVAAGSPTVAEMELAANWQRNFLRENIRIGFYVHN